MNPEALFSELLSRPLHRPLNWKSREPGGFELCLRQGVTISPPQGETGDEALETALDDFRDFLALQSIPIGQDGVPITLKLLPGEAPHRFEIGITPEGVTVSATNSAGLRRGLVALEDEMQANEGPLLRYGKRGYREVIPTRISRCFYGPIQRPPLNRNELEDDINYYPDAYLNRLAHDGVTALWITVKFQQSVPSRLFPEFGAHAEKHLEKLQRTVARCARYGIRIYGFAIEPAALPIHSPLLSRHPELRGVQHGDLVGFCTSSPIGKAYVEEAAETLFREVPGLGGLIIIPVGERFTHCASLRSDRINQCPRCAKLGRYQVLEEVLTAFRRGMNRAAPEAELIAWPYGQMICWGAEAVEEAARHIPPGVILQHNYETGGAAIQLGKPRPLWDYWLSWTGVSPLFEGAAKAVREKGGRISAKLQVGNSHENATVPFVPVPGLLYRKYRAMHEQGVSAVMQSWYFGNFPSLMTRAAGLLSYAPLPATEEEFLILLASKEWGKQAGRVAKAWQHFGRGYEHFPASHVFSYYGPVQNGLTWPLHLIPRRSPLSPSWKINFPPSGDYLPHCFSHYFRHEEILTLCAEMSREWQKGLRLLRQAYGAGTRTPAQTHELQIAEVIGLQFENTAAVLQFYALREKLADTADRQTRLRILESMEIVVQEEILRRRKLIPLLKSEPTVGYHSEAEGFKVTPELVESGINQLERLLSEEFPLLRKRSGEGMERWFGDYTGRMPLSPTVPLELHSPSASAPDWSRVPHHPLRYWYSYRSALSGQSTSSEENPSDIALPASADFAISPGQTALYLSVALKVRDDCHWEPTMIVEIEPARMQPRVMFHVSQYGLTRSFYEDGYILPNPMFNARWETTQGAAHAILEIPFLSLEAAANHLPFRFNVKLLFYCRRTGEYRELSWIKRQPMQDRLIWGDTNPATDYGWAIPKEV